MKWLTKNFAPVTLVLLLGTGAILYLTGKLHLHWNGEDTAFLAEAHSSEEGKNHEEEGEHFDAESHIVEEKVVLDEEAVEASGIRTEPVKKGSIAVNLQVTSEVRLAEDRVAHVTARIPGMIREVHKSLGDEVFVGTPLCTIESAELGEARAMFISALSERKLTERNFERWKQLFEKGIKTQNEFWTAENEFTRAKLNLEAAEAKLKALGIGNEEIAELEKGGSRTLTNRYVVKSPIGGFILDRHATLGENVEAKDQLFLAADLSEVWVQASVYEKDFSAIRRGMPGLVHIQGFPNIVFKGQVTYVGQQVDEKTRTIPLRVTVKNGPVPGSEERFALRPGMFAMVDLEISRKNDVLVVPLSAVQTVDNETVVFVQSEASGEHLENEPAEDKHGGQHAEKGSIAFERRVIAGGTRDAEVVEVIQGLEPSELVVVENAYLLKSEFEKSRIGEGHAD